ncbi:MAG: hypothetical protein A2066_21285 [Bacteroidetes bacterium GWB2_41_8]|nr:MAG: hypothetical protein A2066_21285 [Bacteroidetes bacterium GWB2_41_8]
MTEKEILEFRNSLTELIIGAHRSDAVRLIDEISKTTGYFTAINEILEPALLEIGELWSKEKLSLAQGYVAAKITEDVLEKALQTSEWQSRTPQKKVPVVLANIEDDFHSLGRKMVGTFLQANGWKVHDLGNDVTAAEMVDAAIQFQAPIIGVSAMMYTTAINIRKVREEIDRRNLQDKIKLAVGGAVFKVRPGLTAEVGGDGTTDNATQVSALFSELLQTIKN